MPSFAEREETYFRYLEIGTMIEGGFVDEIESALSNQADSKFLDGLHFTLSGALRTEEHISLKEQLVDMKKWVPNAYDLLCGRLEVLKDFDSRVRERLNNLQDT